MLHSRDRFQQWLPALFDGEFDWDFLLPAFKETKISPMDFDAVVERRGKVLIFETKNVGQKIDIGQRITLTDQWRKGATIFHLSGKTPQTINGLAMYIPSAYKNNAQVGDYQIEQATWPDVLFQARRWFCWANDWKQPTRAEWDNELWLWDYDRKAVGQ